MTMYNPPFLEYQYLAYVKFQGSSHGRKIWDPPNPLKRKDQQSSNYTNGFEKKKRKTP